MNPHAAIEAAVAHAEFLDSWRPPGHPGQNPVRVDHIREAREAVRGMVDALTQISLAEFDNATPAADKVRTSGKLARAALERFLGE